MSNDEKAKAEKNGNETRQEQAASSDPSFLGSDDPGAGDGEEHRTAGGSAGDTLVDVPGAAGETIRTLGHPDIADGSGNDAGDPDRRPDDDEERYDAG